MIRLLKIMLLMFFRLFFTVEYYGVENIPRNGPAVLAGNHPSYLDPVLIYISSPRPVYFLAWDRLFKIPILGQLIRAFGAMPVDLTKKDSGAFDAAMKVLSHGDLLALFPEGHRSEHGILENLKSGAARLAIFNKCPMVPITITGAYEAWPVHQILPLPRKITVKFYPPIVPDPISCDTRRDDHEFYHEIMEQWREQVNKRLLPGLRAQEALNRHFQRPPSHLRVFELAAIGAFLIMLFAPVSRLALALPIVIYYLYLALDILALPPGRVTKVLRDLSTPILMAAWLPTLAHGVKMPQFAFISLIAMLACLLLPYYWTNYYDAQRFLRGITICYYVGLALEMFNANKTPFGLHIVLPVFALVYALIHRSLHWYSQLVAVILYLAAFYIIVGKAMLFHAWPYLVLAIAVNIYMLIFKFTTHDGRVV